MHLPFAGCVSPKYSSSVFLSLCLFRVCRLRETLLNNFPLLTESDVDLLVPKEGVVQSRLNLPQVPKPAGGGPQQPGALTPLLSSTSTNKCTLYSVGDITFLAEVNGIFFPTVRWLPFYNQKAL